MAEQRIFSISGNNRGLPCPFNYGQPPIQRMAEKLVEASGASYRIAYEMFRFYVTGLDLDSFKSEIDRVTDPGIFTVLWSVEISDERQDVASRKCKEPHG